MRLSNCRGTGGKPLLPMVALLFAMSAASGTDAADVPRAGATVQISVTIHPKVQASFDQETFAVTDTAAVPLPGFCISSPAATRYTMSVTGSNLSAGYALEDHEGDQVRYQLLFDDRPLESSTRYSMASRKTHCDDDAHLWIRLEEPFTEDVSHEYRDVLTLTISAS